MLSIANTISKARIGTLLITSFQSIAEFDNSWNVLEKFKKLMSWGTCTIFIQVKSN